MNVKSTELIWYAAKFVPTPKICFMNAPAQNTFPPAPNLPY